MNGLVRLFHGRALDASFALAIALLLGRVTGLLREFQLASVFGVSQNADIAVLLLALPDLLVGLLLAGGLSAALVPRFRRLDAAAGATLFRHAALLAGAAFGALGLVMALAPDLLFAVFAPGIGSPSQVLLPITPALVALALPLTALSGVVTALLNARGRYFVAGLGTLIFNLAIIASLAIGGPAHQMLRNLAVAIAGGALLRLLSQLWIVPRATWRDYAPQGKPDLTVANAFFAGVAAAGLALLAPVLVRAAASLLGEGSVAAFNYAQKLVELPVGILITTISTVALTAFGGLVADGDKDALERAVAAQMRRALLTAIAVFVFGVLFAEPLVRIVFGRGAMDSAALVRITGLLRTSLVGVPFIAIASISTALLNARLQTRRTMILNGIAVAALPLLMAPGILMNDDMMLIGAVVAFQAFVALLLARSAGIAFASGGGVFNRRFFIVAASCGALALVCAEVVTYAKASDWIALGLAGFGFCMAMASINWARI